MYSNIDEQLIQKQERLSKDNTDRKAKQQVIEILQVQLGVAENQITIPWQKLQLPQLPPAEQKFQVSQSDTQFTKLDPVASQLSELETEIQDSRTVPKQIQESDLQAQVTKASDVSRTDSDGPQFAQVSDVQLQRQQVLRMRPGLQAAGRVQVRGSLGGQQTYRYTNIPRATNVIPETEMQPQEKDHEIKQLQQVLEEKESDMQSVLRATLSLKEAEVAQLAQQNTQLFCVT